jgi:serine/threonine-protein kinase
MNEEKRNHNLSSFIHHPSSLIRPDDPRVDQLLEELLDSGGTPEEACRTCPELLPQVRAGWQRLRALQAEVGALFPQSPSSDIATPPPLPAADLPRIRGYEVQEVLGRGGMGVVYKAWHRRLHRMVAVKMLLAGAYAQPQELERFLREAETVAGLRHANIVQVHEAGDVDGRPYFTMEFVEGGSLAQKLAGAPQPACRAAALVAGVAEAVHAAHQSGIVHRDLKPANILLTADGTPKITDFGLARHLEGAAGLTHSGNPVGTPSYMAPEQAEGRSRDVGPAADTYALGAILYELLTGRPPFRAETAAETLRQVVSQDLVPPSRLNAKVPRDLETVCLKCLRKEPHLRYASAAALAEDLRRFLLGEAILARPERRLERLVRRLRRRPLLSAAMAVATLFAVALAGGALWLKSERAAAERAAEQDLRDMAGWLRASSWPEARAALERAKGRLSDRGSAELQKRLEQGARDLELATRVEGIRQDCAQSIVYGFASANPDDQYEAAFRGAGLGQVHDDPEVIADWIRRSDIPSALVAALDHWSSCTLQGARRRSWILDVARRADPDPTGWRDRARDPNLRTDQVALAEVIKAAPVADQSVPLLLAICNQLKPENQEQLAFLKRIQQAHPGDFWANIALGDRLEVREKNPAEAIRYYQAAASIRPQAALGYFKLGRALSSTGRLEEAAGQFRQAVDADPTFLVSQLELAIVLLQLGRHDEAIDRLQIAVRSNPNAAGVRAILGYWLNVQGRHAEALSQYQEAVALDPKHKAAQGGLRTTMVLMGRAAEAWVAWQKALEADPSDSDDRCAYAEFCLFLGRDEEYCRTRQALLSQFGSTTDPRVAARTAQACLLLPATGDELRQAAALAERAAAAEPSNSPANPVFLFAQGLAEFRRGRFDQAVSAMRGDAGRVLRPAPRLVLAMALHRSGKTAEARQTLAAAVVDPRWTANPARFPSDWSSHVLRREAEALILPNLPAFLDGKYQPQDNGERLALLGAGQFANRPLALARLYAAAFAADPGLTEDLAAGHRYRAAGAAVLAGCGRGEDAPGLGEAEGKRWRDQARHWLRADLAAWDQALSSAPASGELRRTLAAWRDDPDLVGVREPGALAKLSDEERKEWLALWREVEALLSRTASR